MSLRRVILILLLAWCVPKQAIAQDHRVFMNHDYHNPEKEKIFLLWKQYLTQKEHTDTLWSLYDRARYKGVDIMKDAVGLSDGLYKFAFDYNVLSISETGNDFLIKTALMWHGNDTAQNGESHVFAIINVNAIKENDGYKLSNYINFATKTWNEKQVGKIVYHYPQTYSFDIFQAKRANDFLASLSGWFQLQIDTIHYFIPANCTESHKIAGFEYLQGDGTELNLCGYYDPVNNMIYSNATAGACYKHELVHQVNNKYRGANEYILSGLAAYIDDAGQFGKPEKFHIKRFLEYYSTHKTDLNSFFELYYIDEITSPIYVFGATICNAIVRKGGIEMLRTVMTNVKTDAELVAFIKDTFKTKDLNVFFRDEFQKYLEQSSVLLNTEK